MPAALLPVPDDVQEARSVRADNWTDLAELREHAPQIRETASSAGGSARQDSHGTRLRHASAGRACGDGRRGSVKLLLDTHTLLWWLNDDRRLGQQAQELIADPGNDVLVSAVSLWAIAVKIRVGEVEADIGEISEASEQERTRVG